MSNNFEGTSFSQEFDWKNKEWHELTDEEILWANIKKYEDDEVIRLYDDDDQIGVNYEFLEQETIFPVLTRHLAEKCGTPLSAIDVCGGAGKSSFILDRCGGCSIILLDSSQKMLELAQSKMRRYNVTSIEPVQADAISYLSSDVGPFDIMIFSSAIHHFKDPFNLLHLAFQRLSPHGQLVIVGEPNRIVSSPRYQRLLNLYAFFVSAEHRRQLIRSIPERIKGTYVPPDYRDPAEYHAHIGIDDHALRRQMEAAGMYINLHIRYPAGPRFATRILPLLGLNWVMGMVVARQPDPALTEQLKKALKTELPYRVQFFC